MSKVNPALAVLNFAYELSDAHETKDFLEYWFEGDFDSCRQLFPSAPEECYIGADASHPETQKILSTESDDARDAEMFRKLLASCADMGAKKFDDCNDPGELRIVLKFDNRNSFVLVTRMRQMMVGFCSRVEAP